MRHTSTRSISTCIARIAAIGCASAQTTPPEFDIDGDGVCNASVDTALAARYLKGFRGEALIAGILPSNGGTTAGKQSGSALFEQNVAYNNWSANMYFDIFNHPIDYNPATTNFLYVGSEYPYN